MSPNGWWKGRSSTSVGWFPSNFVTIPALLPTQEPQKAPSPPRPTATPAPAATVAAPEDAAGGFFRESLDEYAVRTGRPFPLFLERAAAFIRRDLSREGLFRLPPAQTELAALVAALTRDEATPLEDFSVYAVCAAANLFLLLSGAPLFGTSRAPDLDGLLRDLPFERRALFVFWTDFLAEVAGAAGNRMGAEALATIFGQYYVTPPAAAEGQFATLSYMQRATRVVQQLLEEWPARRRAVAPP